MMGHYGRMLLVTDSLRHYFNCQKIMVVLKQACIIMVTLHICMETGKLPKGNY